MEVVRFEGVNVYMFLENRVKRAFVREREIANDAVRRNVHDSS